MKHLATKNSRNRTQDNLDFCRCHKSMLCLQLVITMTAQEEDRCTRIVCLCMCVCVSYFKSHYAVKLSHQGADIA